MPQLPVKPEIETSYTAFQQSQGDNSFPGTDLDADLANLKASVDALIDFLGGSFRTDGRLRNGSVGADQLGSDFRVGFPPPEPWAADTEYAVNASVFFNNVFYICALAHHSSGSFATDLSAGKWVALVDFAEAAEGALSAFYAVYLGARAADPTADLNGNALTAGALYLNTTASQIRIWNGSTWVAASTGSVGLADSQVTEPKLADGAVSRRALAANAVGAAQIENGTVGTAELADGAVTAPKMAANMVYPSTFTAQQGLKQGVAGLDVAYLDVLQVGTAGAYTLALSDRGRHVLAQGAVTIPADSTVAFPTGAAVAVVNDTGASITITPAAGVTLRLAATAATGARTVAQRGLATLLKIRANEWLATGAGLT